MPLYKEVQTDFNIDQYLLLLMSSNIFYSEISRHVRKIPTEIPTAGVYYDEKYDDLVMEYNPEFFKSLKSNQIKGILIHEFSHILFGHIFSGRKYEPHILWNWSTDLAINSLIEAMFKSSDYLPEGVLIPGKRPKNLKKTSTQNGKKNVVQQDEQSLGDIIAKFPKLLSSEEYYYMLKKHVKIVTISVGGGGGQGDQKQSGNGDDECQGDGNGGDESGNGGGKDQNDQHEGWGDHSPEQKEMIEEKVKDVIRQAAKAADKSSTGWGSIPAEIVSAIREYISNKIDWRTVLRQFTGTLIRGEKTNSIKKINRKYPYIHPGFKRNHRPKLLIAIDESGSVGNDTLELFFGELVSLMKRVDIDIVCFDTVCGKVEQYRKGQKPNVRRLKCGGTSFDAVTELVNDKKNRGRWDGVLIMTDGECCQPNPTRIKRAWALQPGSKLMFESKDTQFVVEKGMPLRGTWR